MTITGQEQLDVLYHQAVPNLLRTTVEEDNVVCVMEFHLWEI
jgi:hypothetical protein